MRGDFDVQKQCPQIYIYILSILTSILVTIRYGKAKQVISTVITGTIVTILLMGVNYCDWTFQWLTWIFAALSILVATTNILLFVSPDKIMEEEI